MSWIISFEKPSITILVRPCERKGGRFLNEVETKPHILAACIRTGFGGTWNVNGHRFVILGYRYNPTKQTTTPKTATPPLIALSDVV